MSDAHAEVEIGSEKLLEQAWMTASHYMVFAVQEIDKQFGDGYAKAHPELVGAFMQTAATDFQAGLLKVGLQDLRTELEHWLGQLASW